MDEEQRLSEFFQEAGSGNRQSFLKRVARAAAVLVGLGGGALLRPGAAFADPPGVYCGCINVELHSIDCEECPLCCAGASKSCIVETFVGRSCANHNVICWWETLILCVCCC